MVARSQVELQELNQKRNLELEEFQNKMNSMEIMSKENEELRSRLEEQLKTIEQLNIALKDREVTNFPRNFGLYIGSHVLFLGF